MPKDKSKPTRKLPALPLSEQLADANRRTTACEAMVESIAAVLGVDLVGELTLETMPHNLALIMAALRKPQPTQALLAVSGETVGEPDPDHEVFSDPQRETVRELLIGAARDLGVATGKDAPIGELAGVVAAEIMRLKGTFAAGADDGASVDTGDSLAQAVDYLRQGRRRLEDEIFGVRLIVNRVAAVLNVQHWDREGTEVLAALNALKASRARGPEE